MTVFTMVCVNTFLFFSFLLLFKSNEFNQMCTAKLRSNCVASSKKRSKCRWQYSKFGDREQVLHYQRKKVIIDYVWSLMVCGSWFFEFLWCDLFIKAMVVHFNYSLMWKQKRPLLRMKKEQPLSFPIDPKCILEFSVAKNNKMKIPFCRFLLHFCLDSDWWSIK